MHHADGTIAELTEKIRLTPRRMSKRGIEGRWHLKLRTLYRERGDLYEAKGDYDKAIEDYSEVIKTFIQGRTDHWSELVCDYFSRARAYRLKGDYDCAIADYSAMIELYPQCFLADTRGGLRPTIKFGVKHTATRVTTEKRLRTSPRPSGLMGARLASSARMGSTSQRRKRWRKLREHGRTYEIARERQTGFGPRFIVEGDLNTPSGHRPRVRTVWQLDDGTIAPRLFTAHPLEAQS